MNAGKEKPGVIRRLNRGRSAPDSKGKTDSGCFVDEELERNGSSDSSQGSINSSPVREKNSKKDKPTHKESTPNTDTAFVLSSEPATTEENASKNQGDGKENVMNENTKTDDKSSASDSENVDTVCDVVEKTRRASDFYCLYYSASPEGTLTKSDDVKLRKKPPVAPKPKLRRGSAPPSSFNHIERVYDQNKDITKRFSYNEDQTNTSKSEELQLSSPNCEKRKSVEERVLFFEAFAKDDLAKSTLFNNVQAANFKNLSAVPGRKDLENLQNPSGSHFVQNGLDQGERIAPLADNEEFSFESCMSNCESVNYDQEVHIAETSVHVPLAEDDEFSINGSNFYQSSVNCSTVDENCNNSENGRKCLDCVEEVDEMEDPEHFFTDENQNGVHDASHYNDQQCSDPVIFKIGEETVNDVQTKDSCNRAPQSAIECFDKEEDLLVVKTPSGDSDCYASMPNPKNEPVTCFSEKLVNPRLNEIKQELLISSRHNDGNKKQRRPGSIAGLSNLENDVTSTDLKRRSWSFSESTHPVDANSPFLRKVYQVPSPKLTTSSWHSESGLSSPFVRSVQQNQPIQRTPTGTYISQQSGRPWSGVVSYVDNSGYTSDDSSVHSEPLFQPLRHRPQIQSNGRILKSMSVDSDISLLDSGGPSSLKVQRRRFRHSLGSRDPIFALRRQSVEFAEEEQPPTFRPVSPVQLPHLQTLKRASSYTSSSSDSEVERIFKQPEASTSRYHRNTTDSIHGGLANTVPRHKVSAMEALFGPQSTRSIAHSSDSEQSSRKTLSERFSEVPAQPTEEDLFSEGLEEEEITAVDEVVPREIEEPRLEFDDTDYSEFYTRCEDKESLITAEALSIKKLLQSPQTVLPDPDIESVVMTVTERKVSLPNLDKEETKEIENVLCEDDTDNVDVKETASELQMAEQFYRQHRGTQTPPPEVFKALSPPPSVATQTPPIPVSQELPSLLLKELELQILTPTITRPPPPTTSQSEEARHSSSLEHFRAVPPCSAPVTDTDLLPPSQEADRAVSVEELLQILAGMQVGPPKETQSRKPVSVQKYDCPSPQDENTKSSKTPKSLPSSWQHLSSPTGKHNTSEVFKKPSCVPPRSSKSYDCLRRGLSAREKRNNVIEAKMVQRNESSEDIRKKLKEWKLRSQLFEEEVECLEGKGDGQKQPECKEEKALKVSYDGSESTDSIETQSKLTNTHSLKRPRKDRAFSQKDENCIDGSSLDKKPSFSLTPTNHEDLKSNNAKDSDGKVKKSFSSYEEEESELELTSSDGKFLKNEALHHEIASPEGVEVFIDYRKKNGMHITSTPKPPPDPDKNIFVREDRVGKLNLDKVLQQVLSEKPAGASATEDKLVLTDVESQGDASSSSYSSDDDHFGEFGGSTETVVFVDTEPNPEVSLEADLENLDLNLIGGDKLLSVNNNDDDDEKDESRLDALLGEVRRSLNLEFVDSDILDKAIDRFKQRVSPKSENKALCGGLSMEAYVALHQADELQGLISEIKGELKLLHDENDMLREQVVSLANNQTNGEVTENSSTESSERLENLCKLYKLKHGDTEDEEAVEIEVCLRGFSVVPLGHLSSKKTDIHLGTVTVKGADWNGVMEAARKTFVDHMRKIDPEDYLCLGAHSIQGVQTGVMVLSPGSLRRSSPRVELSNKSNPCVIQLKDGSHFSCDSLVYDTLLPKEAVENYVEQLLEHRCIVLCGQQGLGKSYLAAKLAEHVVQRIGWKKSPAVVTFNVSQQTRKDLKRDLASVMENSMSGSKDGIPAVIVLDQLNCLASLADIFDFSQLEKDSSCPYIIGVRDKSRKGPFSSKELRLCHYFRWLRVSVNDRQYSGLLGRFLRRKLTWSQIKSDVESDDLLELFDWLSKVWYHLNEILEDFCDSDATIGPSLFFSCPMDYKAAEGWFVNVWNYNVIPYLHQALRSGRKIFDRCASWEDPTKWVVLRYPWDKDHSRVFHTLRKLRQVDVVLNRNQLGSDNVSFAECIEDNEKILRAHSTVSKRVRTVVKEKIPKGELEAKRKTAEQREGHRCYEDRDSSYSDTDSYLETSI